MTTHPEPIIVGLDLGAWCGWANLEGPLMLSGVWNLNPSRWEGGGMRFVKFIRNLESLVFGVPPQRLHVFFEEVRRHLGVDAAHAYGGYLGHLTAWCERANVPYAGIPVATIKRLATGSAIADKQAMLDAARRRWPRAVIATDDEADARFVALAGYAMLGGTVEAAEPTTRKMTRKVRKK